MRRNQSLISPRNKKENLKESKEFPRGLRQFTPALPPSRDKDGKQKACVAGVLQLPVTVVGFYLVRIDVVAVVVTLPNESCRRQKREKESRFALSVVDEMVMMTMLSR